MERYVGKDAFSKTHDEKSIRVGSGTISRDSQIHHKLYAPLNLPKEPSAALEVNRSPELLENIDSAQCLGFRPFVPPLSIPQFSLQFRHVTQKIFVIGGVWFCMFNVRLGIIKLALVEEQPHQKIVNPK